MSQIYIQPYSSPCGELLLGSLGGGLCLCDWVSSPRHSATRRRLRRAFPGAATTDAPSPVTERAALELSEYFAGGRRAFSVPLLLAGTEFQKSVWQSLLRGIPYGATLSYSVLAQAVAGRPESARAVAAAVGANGLSIFVPCHRVVGQGGKLTGYAGGLRAKRFLLQLEAANARRSP